MAIELNIHQTKGPQVKVYSDNNHWISVKVNGDQEVTWFFATQDDQKAFMRSLVNCFAEALEWRETPYATTEIDDEIKF
jgi:hypothetical protein